MSKPTLEFKALLRAITTLKQIRDGSQNDGRWLDASGSECDEDDPGAKWTEFTQEEQAIWLSSVAQDADEALTAIREWAIKSDSPNANAIVEATEDPDDSDDTDD